MKIHYDYLKKNNINSCKSLDYIIASMLTYKLSDYKVNQVLHLIYETPKRMVIQPSPPPFICTADTVSRLREPDLEYSQRTEVNRLAISFVC